VNHPLSRLGRRLLNPAQARQFLESLGPTFVKIGQYLALRPDLVPQEYCDEFLKLVDRVQPFPWAEAQRVLEEDWPYGA
jgi:ubiquinone biosynthesis protein